MSSTPRYRLTGVQQFFFVLLRIGIGWHFLREGWVKLSDPTWTAAGYLSASWGPFAQLYHQIPATPWLMNLSNLMMPWALFLVGLGLMLGVFTRLSILGGVALLAMFYCCTPPIEAMPPYARWGVTGFQWTPYLISLEHAQWAGEHMINCEGNYMIVNKNIVEMFALLALLTVNSGKSCGLDALIHQWFSKNDQPSDAPMQPSES